MAGSTDRGTSAYPAGGEEFACHAPSDDEVIEALVTDRRRQLLLDCLDAGLAPFPRARWSASALGSSDIASQIGHANGGRWAVKVYVYPRAEALARARAHLDQVIGGRGERWRYTLASGLVRRRPASGG